MKRLYAFATIVVFSLFCGACADDHATNTGAISGSISPEDAAVRIIAKIAGTNYEEEGSIKGEVTLTKGGDFIIEGLPAGTYDLFFSFRENQQRSTSHRVGVRSL